jgi:hypothetical protein
MAPLSKADFTRLISNQYKNLALGGYKGMIQIKVQSTVEILKPILDRICSTIGSKLAPLTPWVPEYTFDGKTIVLYFNSSDPSGLFLVPESDTSTVVAELC